MKMKAKSLTGRWLSDQMLSVLLGLLILRILIIQPLALLGYIHPVLIYILLSLILLSGVMVVMRTRVLIVMIGGML